MSIDNIKNAIDTAQNAITSAEWISSIASVYANNILVSMNDYVKKIDVKITSTKNLISYLNKINEIDGNINSIEVQNEGITSSINGLDPEDDSYEETKNSLLNEQNQNNGKIADYRRERSTLVNNAKTAYNSIITALEFSKPSAPGGISGIKIQLKPEELSTSCSSTLSQLSGDSSENDFQELDAVVVPSDLAATINLSTVKELIKGYITTIKTKLSSLLTNICGYAAEFDPSLSSTPVITEQTSNGNSVETESFVTNTPSSSPTGGARPTFIEYKVQPGDTLSEIALEYYGDPNKYPEIAAANGIDNPDLIPVGMILCLPGIGTGSIIAQNKDSNNKTNSTGATDNQTSEKNTEENNIKEPNKQTNAQNTNTQGGTEVYVPDDVKQTGICKNNTDYNYFYDKWRTGTEQRKIADTWAENGSTSDRGIATIDDNYLVAVSPVFGEPGDKIAVVLEDGTIINCIIADQKGVDAENPYGHYLGLGDGSKAVDIIEWEITTEKANVDLDGWAGKNVEKVINYGDYFETSTIGEAEHNPGNVF